MKNKEAAVSTKQALRGLVTLSDLSDAEIREAIRDSVGLYGWLARRRSLDEQSPFADLLRGGIVHLAFFEPSTRTRVSFETAALHLGASVINFGGDATSVAKGESLEDTAATLAAMDPDLMVVRHPHTGAAAKLAGYLACPVINAGDGRGHHPTQALLDAATVHAEMPVWDDRDDGSGGGSFNGLSALLSNTSKTGGAVDKRGRAFRPLHVVIVGDIRNSRVARSNAELWTRFGHRVTLVGPPALLPCAPPYPGVALAVDAAGAIRDADVLMMLRIQKERMHGGMSGISDFRTMFGLSSRRLALLPKRAIILHPGPCNRGIEIDDAVYADPRCRIRQQVRYGVAVRMHIMAKLLGGQP